APLLSKLALSWLTCKPWQIGREKADAPTFLAQHVRAVSERVESGIALPLCSTPTHAGGWIERDTFRKRFAVYQKTDQFDIALAALRAGDAPVPSWLTTYNCDAPLIRWIATLAPFHRDRWFQIGATVIGHNLDWWYAAWQNQAYFGALFDPD